MRKTADGSAALLRLSAAQVQRNGPLVALLLIILFATLRYDSFLTETNLWNVLRQNSMLGLVALGMTFVIISGGIDLSVGSLVALADVLAAGLSKYGLAAAILAPVAVGTLLGLANGLLVARARIAPFIVTLGTMIAIRGIALAATGEVSVRVDRLNESFTVLGRGLVGPVPVPVILFLALCGVGALLLNLTSAGRNVLAIGGNEEAARLMGLPVERTKVLVYAINGALASLAGVVLASRLGAGQPVAGQGWELDAIAAVVLGGTLLTGGIGKVSGTIIGVLILGLLFNIFNLEGTFSSWWQWVLRGALLMLVVIVQSRFRPKNT